MKRYLFIGLIMNPLLSSMQKIQDIKESVQIAAMQLAQDALEAGLNYRKAVIIPQTITYGFPVGGELAEQEIKQWHHVNASLLHYRDLVFVPAGSDAEPRLKAGMFLYVIDKDYALIDFGSFGKRTVPIKYLYLDYKRDFEKLD